MQIKASNNSGSIRLWLIFIVIIGMLFWAGGQGLYVSLTNRTPTVLSYDDYAKSNSKASWLAITNCMLDLADASYRTTSGSTVPTELYIPVTGLGDKSDQVRVLLATKSSRMILALAELENKKTESEALAWMMKNHELAFPKNGVKGLVRFGLDMKEKDRSKLLKLQPNLTKDFIILDDGQEPSLVKSLGMIAGGVALLGVGGFMILRKKDA